MVFVLCGTPKYFPTIKLVFCKLGTIEISGKIILKYNEDVMLGLQELQIIQGFFCSTLLNDSAKFWISVCLEIESYLGPCQTSDRVLRKKF